MLEINRGGNKRFGVIAGIHAGLINRFSCDQCSRTPALQEQYACGRNTRAKRPVFEMEDDKGGILRYWNCPINFIPESVVEFTRQYRYQKDFPSVPMPEFTAVSKRWVLAYQYYENKLSQFQAERFKSE